VSAIIAIPAIASASITPSGLEESDIEVQFRKREQNGTQSKRNCESGKRSLKAALEGKKQASDW
jgi:hypothetical protein